MDIIYTILRFKTWTAALLLFLGLGLTGLGAQNSGPYEKLVTSVNVPVSDTISGINLDLNKVSPLAKHGTVQIIVLQSGGSGNPWVYEVRYTPSNGFTGVDTFTLEYIYQGVYPYLVYRGFEVSIYPSIVVTRADYGVTAAGTPVTVNVLANDSGAGALSIGSLPLSDHGTASFSGNEITFTPDAGYTGIAHVNYTVCDSANSCKTGQLDVGIHPANGEPQNDTIRFATSRNKAYDRPLMFDGYSLFQSPSNGLLTLGSGGHSFTYEPANGFTGNDQFVLSNVTSAGNTVYLTVLAEVINTPGQNRMAIDDYYYTPVDKAISGNVRQNDIGNLLVKSWVIPPNLPGTVSGTTSGGNFTFTPNAGFSGVATFHYRLGNSSAPNLEMAAVHITVGNLPPVLSTYELTTPVNTPLVIRYPLPFNTFEFQITDAPDHGTAEFFPGFSTHVYGSDTVSGINLLIYEPDAGFTGVDPFEVNYCMTTNNFCSNVKVNASVVDVLSSSPPYCLNECIWTGDLNNDGIVNNKDVLNLGYAMGLTGEDRPNAALEWYGQSGDAWNDPYHAYLADLKYADTDGNGAINHEDTLAIGFFYGNTHNLAPSYPLTSKGLPFKLKVLTPNPGKGDLVVVDIFLGDDDEPVSDLYGFTFDMTLSPDIVDSNFHMTYATDAWTNINSPYLTFQRRPEIGRLETAFTRTGIKSATGYGYIARAEFIIIDVIDGVKPTKNPYFVIFVDGPLAQWGNGDLTQSQPIAIPVPMKYNSKGGAKKREDESLVSDSDLIVYPNPARDELNIHLNGSDVIREWQLFDIDGRLLEKSGKIELERTSLAVAQLPAGVYMLRVQTNTGTLVKRVVIER